MSVYSPGEELGHEWEGWDIIWVSLCSSLAPTLMISSGHLGQTTVGAWSWFLCDSHLPFVLRGAAELAIAPGSPMVCSPLGGAVTAAGYHGDREAMAQGSLQPAKGNCCGSWRRTM